MVMERWWLSFGSEETGVNLGCCIVDVPMGDGMMGAIHKSHRLCINPGGQVQGHRMDLRDSTDIDLFGKDKLISRCDLIKAGY